MTTTAQRAGRGRGVWTFSPRYTNNGPRMPSGGYTFVRASHTALTSFHLKRHPRSRFFARGRYFTNTGAWVARNHPQTHNEGSQVPVEYDQVKKSASGVILGRNVDVGEWEVRYEDQYVQFCDEDEARRMYNWVRLYADHQVNVPETLAASYEACTQGKETYATWLASVTYEASGAGIIGDKPFADDFNLVVTAWGMEPDLDA